jgi:hypothetical protein
MCFVCLLAAYFPHYRASASLSLLLVTFRVIFPTSLISGVSYGIKYSGGDLRQMDWYLVEADVMTYVTLDCKK